nr:HAMP domain-containing sensor histidine kinase [Sphingobium subterraneum]
MLQTVLAAPERTGLGAVTQWRQCVDMLAQYDSADNPQLAQSDRAVLIQRLTGLRTQITETQRISSVVELGSRLRSPALIELFAHDRPAVCAAAMSRANLPDPLWPALLPRLGPTARGVLRGRRDVGDLTRRALEAFGATDLVLAGTAGEAASVMDLTPAMAVAPAEAPTAADEAESASQIRQLVDRIERFTSLGRARPSPTPPTPVPHEDADLATARHFAFETDSAGAIVWVDGGSRAALIGLMLGETALPGMTGADGHIVGAFIRRSSFQHGRLWISDGPYEGEWRLSAIPFFDPASGRFQGYRGQARRPHLHEVPHAPRAEQERREAISLDSMRQLIHELRTPLNAILGFAEIIEQQLFGPADVHYREMAGNILGDARRLLTAFDDLDLAARSVSPGHERQAAKAARAVDLEALIDSACGLFDQWSGTDRHPSVKVTAAVGLPHVLVDPVQGERMIQHLLRTLISVLRHGEMLQGSTWFQPDGDGGQVLLAFDRPSRLADADEAQIMDPGYGADGSWPDAPLLGLGFSLRLVRSLAHAHGGSLHVEGNRILLALPVAFAHAEDEAGSH